ncbi:MAG: tRNA guanosine(34) transglycosylase Tgt [Flavobacteriaceae bacterium]|nr:tRNA guanosine(34) transglycosylase Tgt [Flavobacteriaceae bacterium]
MKFDLECVDKFSRARVGTIYTDRGVIETPIFMPVGTSATVKGVHQRELEKDVNPDIILANTYHLYLRPSSKVLEQSGGIHKFMNWSKPILTDSGGYQVYSLSSKTKIKEEGVIFKSHIDGSSHFFSPESAISIQRRIGADIIMAFDECTPYPCDFKYAEKSMERTHRWLNRCIDQNNKEEFYYSNPQILFPIIQGSVYKDLREKSTEFILKKNMFGNAIGGLSVGEPAEEMYKMSEAVTSILPSDKPRYLMGVGTPINLLENISLGIDMFDCVMPTRNARNGMIFTENGTINIKNKKWEFDFTELDSNNYCFVDTNYSKAYVRHLFKSNEMLGKQICTIHNLAFYMWLVRESRKHILAGDFISWKEKMIKRLGERI